MFVIATLLVLLRCGNLSILTTVNIVTVFFCICNRHNHMTFLMVGQNVSMSKCCYVCELFPGATLCIGVCVGVMYAFICVLFSLLPLHENE